MRLLDAVMAIVALVRGNVPSDQCTNRYLLAVEEIERAMVMIG